MYNVSFPGLGIKLQVERVAFSIGDFSVYKAPSLVNISDISDVVSEDHGGITTYLVKSDGTKTAVNTLFK